MKLDLLTTYQFRNLKEITFEAQPGINIIYGDNAQGKTNLMEAVWLLTGNKSFRGAKENELATIGKQRYKLYAEFTNTERLQTAEVWYESNKKAKLNGVALKSATELARSFFAVAFSPTDLQLIKETPEKRRHFLDTAIGQLKPSYQNYLVQYGKVLAQRNALLKEVGRFPDLRPTIDLWDEQLAKLGTILTIYRNDYVSKLSVFLKQIYEGISSGKEEIGITYRSSVFEENDPITKYTDSIINIYYNVLQSKLEEDLTVGFTSCGIHRDDLEFTVNGISAKSFGSQGQQRSCAISLKLAESELLANVSGEQPIILLDDVMSELDVRRQDYILNHLGHQQVILTCCDLSNTLRLKSGNIYKMENGRLQSL